MLARASDLHAGEQQQVIDILDEIRTRLTPIEGFAGEGRTRVRRPTKTWRPSSAG